jgi:hypothetical protein
MPCFLLSKIMDLYFLTEFYWFAGVIYSVKSLECVIFDGVLLVRWGMLRALCARAWSGGAAGHWSELVGSLCQLFVAVYEGETSALAGNGLSE